MTEIDGKEFYSAREIGEEFGLSTTAVLLRAEKGKIPYILHDTVHKGVQCKLFDKDAVWKIRTLYRNPHRAHGQVKRQIWKLAVEVHGVMLIKKLNMDADTAIELAEFFRSCGIEAHASIQYQER